MSTCSFAFVRDSNFFLLAAKMEVLQDLILYTLASCSWNTRNVINHTAARADDVITCHPYSNIGLRWCSDIKQLVFFCPRPLTNNCIWKTDWKSICLCNQKFSLRTQVFSPDLKKLLKSQCWQRTRHGFVLQFIDLSSPSIWVMVSWLGSLSYEYQWTTGAENWNGSYSSNPFWVSIFLGVKTAPSDSSPKMTLAKGYVPTCKRAIFCACQSADWSICQLRPTRKSCWQFQRGWALRVLATL